LGGNPEFDVVDTCSSVADGWQSVVSHQPDVLLLDLKLKDGEGLSLQSARWLVSRSRRSPRR
jgi:DNA-binding NarL/FixJ family response regulator